MNWLNHHQDFSLGMCAGIFAGWLIWGILIRSIEKFAELTLGGAYVRTREIESLEAERDRWKNRYNAQLEATDGRGGEQKK